MSQAAIARRYARALYDLLHAQGDTTVFFDEVMLVSSEIFGDAEIRRFFLNPTIPNQNKQKVMSRTVEGMNPLCGRFLEFVTRKGRIEVLPAVVTAYESLYNQEQNLVVAQVESAAELDESAQAELGEALEALTGCNVSMEVRLEPELIGGVRAQIGSLVYDGSLAGRLNSLKESLVRA